MLLKQQIATDSSGTPENERNVTKTKAFSPSMYQKQMVGNAGLSNTVSSTMFSKERENNDTSTLQPQVAMVLDQLKISAVPKPGSGKYSKRAYSNMKTYANSSLRGYLRKIIPDNCNLPDYGAFESLETLESNRMIISQCQEYMDDMSARATRMNELKQAEIEKEKTDVMEKEIKYVINIILNQTMEDKEVHELLKANTDNFLSLILLEICNEKTHLMAQKYSEKRFTSYEAVLNNACSIYSNQDPYSQKMELLKQHIEIAYLKTRSFQLYENFKTSSMIIKGLKTISSKRMQRIWNEILAEPISKIDWKSYQLENRKNILDACDVINNEYIEHFLKPTVLSIPCPETEKVERDPLHDEPPEKNMAVSDLRKPLPPTDDSLNSSIFSTLPNNFPLVCSLGHDFPTTTIQNQVLPVVSPVHAIQWFQTYLRNFFAISQQLQQVQQVQPIFTPPTPLPVVEETVINSLVAQPDIPNTGSIFPTIPQVFEQATTEELVQMIEWQKICHQST